MNNDFAMIKTVIACRLNKAVGLIMQKVNEYNQKINELRAPIILRIQKHYAERHNFTFVHPLTSSALNKDFLKVTATYLSDDIVRINANYYEQDELNSVNIALHTHVPLGSEFKDELKGIKHFYYSAFDVEAISTEKASELVLEGVSPNEIMKKIEDVVKTLIPVVNIPTIELA